MNLSMLSNGLQYLVPTIEIACLGLVAWITQQLWGI